MHNVFISYSSKDIGIAEYVCHYLESNNIKCWYAPRDIAPGKEWPSEIVNAIRQSKIFLILSTENSNKSKHVVNEIAQATEANCNIIPLKLDKSTPSDSFLYYLQSIHWLDCSGMSLDQAILKLHKRISSIIDPKPPVPPPPPRPLPWVVKILLSLLGVFMVASMVFAGFTLFNRDTEPVDTHTVQSVDFFELTELGKYRYPFCSNGMFSQDTSLFVVENTEDKTLRFVKTDTGYIIGSNVSIDFDNYVGMVLQTKADSDVAYFIDLSDHYIGIYDRNKAEWRAQGSLSSKIDENEYVYSVFYQASTVDDKVSDSNDIAILYSSYDDNQLSKIIYFYSDGTYYNHDISAYNIVDTVSGIDLSDQSLCLVIDENGRLRILDLITGEILDLTYQQMKEQYFEHLSYYERISPDKRYLAYITSNDYPKTLRVWDLETGKSVLSNVYSKPFSCYFTQDNNLLLYSTENNNLVSYDLAAGHSKIIIKEEDFENNKEFMAIPYNFYYIRDYGISVFAVRTENEDGTYRDQLVLTDSNGEVLYKSQIFEVPFASYTSVILHDNQKIIYAITTDDFNDELAKQNYAMSTKIYRALYTVNDENLLDFSE